MELDVSAIFPPNVPVFRCSLPSTGSLGFWFPCFHGTIEHSDFLPPLPRCFVAFASRYRRAPWTSLPQLQDATATSQGLFTGLPHTGSIGGDDRTSQVPGEPHYERALLCDPGGTSARGHYCASMLPSAFLTASAPAIRVFRGSITRPTHSLSTLRRVGHPTTTQDSLPDGWPAFPGGTDYPRGSNERFQVIPFPFPRLSQALPGAPENILKPVPGFAVGVL